MFDLVYSYSIEAPSGWYIVTNGLGISQLLGWVYCDRVIGYIVATRSLSTAHRIGK